MSDPAKLLPSFKGMEPIQKPKPKPKPKKRRPSTGKTATQGRKKEGSEMTNVDRGVALALVDFLGGNFRKASAMTGIPLQTLCDWKHDQNPSRVNEVAQGYTQARGTLLDRLSSWLEAMMAISILKAVDATFKEVHYAMGTMSDKVQPLIQSQVIAQQMLGPHTGELPEHPAPRAITASPEAEALRQEWEATLIAVMEQAENDGHPISRSQAIAGICKAHPEASEYLKEESELPPQESFSSN